MLILVGGSSDIDLSGYVTTTQLTTELNKKANTKHNHTDYAQELTIIVAHMLQL